MKIWMKTVFIAVSGLALMAGAGPAFADKALDDFKQKLSDAEKATGNAQKASNGLKDAAKASLEAEREAKAAMDRRNEAARNLDEANRRLNEAQDEKSRQRAQDEVDKQWEKFRGANDTLSAADKKAKEKAKEHEKARMEQADDYEAARKAAKKAEDATPPAEPKGSEKNREMDRLKKLKENFKKVPPPISPPPPPAKEPTVETPSSDMKTIRKFAGKLTVSPPPPPPPAKEPTVETESPATQGRPGRIVMGGIFLPFFPLCKLDQSQVEMSITGTGETIGTMAHLTLTNNTDSKIAVSVDPLAILPKTKGAFQPFCTTETENVILEPRQTKTIPLKGVCLDPHIKPAGPKDKGVLRIVDPESPEFEQWKGLIAGTQTIIKTTEKLQKDCAYKTPYSKDLKQERDMIVQWTTWLYVTSLAGKPITEDDLAKKVYEQTPKDVTEDQKKEIDDGVKQIWKCIKLTGEKAKLIPEGVEKGTEMKEGPKIGVFAKDAIPGAPAGARPAAPAKKQPKPKPTDPKLVESMENAGLVWDPVSGSWVSKKTMAEREREEKKKREEEERKKYKRVTITMPDGSTKEVIQCPDGTRLSEDDKDTYYIDPNGNKITHHDAELKVREQEERDRKAQEMKDKTEADKASAQAAYDAWLQQEKAYDAAKKAITDNWRTYDADTAKAKKAELEQIKAAQSAHRASQPPKPK